MVSDLKKAVIRKYASALSVRSPVKTAMTSREKPYLLITYYRADIAFANQNRIGRKKGRAPANMKMMPTQCSAKLESNLANERSDVE